MDQNQAVLYLGEAGFYVDLDEKKLIDVNDLDNKIDFAKMYSLKNNQRCVVWYNHILQRAIDVDEVLPDGIPEGTRLYLIPPLRLINEIGLRGCGHDVAPKEVDNMESRRICACQLPVPRSYFLPAREPARPKCLFARLYDRILKPAVERKWRKQ